jgi:hypothetical protein
VDRVSWRFPNTIIGRSTVLTFHIVTVTVDRQ